MEASAFGIHKSNSCETVAVKMLKGMEPRRLGQTAGEELAAWLIPVLQKPLSVI